MNKYFTISLILMLLLSGYIIILDDAKAQQSGTISRNIFSRPKKLCIDDDFFNVSYKNGTLFVDMKVINPENVQFNGSMYISVLSPDGENRSQTMWNFIPLNDNTFNLSNIMLETKLSKDILRNSVIEYVFIYSYLPPKQNCLWPGQCYGRDEQIKGKRFLSDFVN